MTKQELIDEVYRLYQDGDVTQHRKLRECAQWKDDRIEEHPTQRKFNLNDFEYRIKPRAFKYMIETEHYPSQSAFPTIADCMEKWSEGSFPPSFIEAVRNAKRVDE